eukprot:scaffold30343_cov63-Skeletonema_dohrnii-CCMP3373.AAC.2
MRSITKAKFPYQMIWGTPTMVLDHRIAVWYGNLALVIEYLNMNTAIIVEPMRYPILPTTPLLPSTNDQQRRRSDIDNNRYLF